MLYARIYQTTLFIYVLYLQNNIRTVISMYSYVYQKNHNKYYNKKWSLIMLVDSYSEREHTYIHLLAEEDECEHQTRRDQNTQPLNIHAECS